MQRISLVGVEGALRPVPARTIVRAIADAAERWSDGDFPPRVRATAAIEARLGYTIPVVDYALDRLFVPMAAAAFEDAIAGELGALDVLDRFTPGRDGVRRWARGVNRAVIVSSDTTIGVALVPALFALCAKADVVVKDRSDALVTAFFATLAQERPEFASAAIARVWRGGEDAGEQRLLAQAESVVAFGREEALRSIRSAAPPETRFVAHGHRTSIGIVDAWTPLDDATLQAIATDALLYDGEGCLSLHALFLTGGSAAQTRAFATRLAAAFERVEIEFPAAPRDRVRAAAVAAYRNRAAFRAVTGHGAVYRTPGDAAIVTDAPLDEPPPLLPRVLPCYTVETPDDVVAYVRRLGLPVQAVGCVDPNAPDLAAAAVALDAVRVTRFGQMQAPPLGSRHGGFGRVSDFVRWIECT